MSVRLDKWLWAARFFRTRAQAKQAIEGGKVQVNGAKGKPSRELAVGEVLRVRQGWDLRTVEVVALSDQRRGAPEAQALYRETAESIATREEAAANRKALRLGMHAPDGRPEGRERARIARLKRQFEPGDWSDPMDEDT